MKYLINPFIKIAGFKALAFGILVMILASIIAYQTNTHFDGVLSIHSGYKSSYILHLSEIIISWLYTSLLFSLGGLIFSKSKIRIIDIIGTQAFAFIPLFPASFIGAIGIFSTLPERFSGLEPYEITENLFTLSELSTLVVASFVLLFLIIWSAIWMYHGLKISTNLKNKFMLPIYIITIISGFIIPKFLLSFLNL